MEVRTRMQMWKDMYGPHDKEAELAGTYDMPNSKPKEKKKEAEAGISTDADEVLKIAFAMPLNEAVPGKNPASHPQVVLQPHVSTAGKEPKKSVTIKKASRYALPLDERYPLDGYDQVKAAAAYFEENFRQMPIEVRRTYCQNLVKRADELGIPTTDIEQRYGSEKYASSNDIEVALEARRGALASAQHHEVLEKVAACKGRLLPEQFADLLSSFDRMAGITHLYDAHIPDPYLSTFGKTAAAAPSPDSAIMVGNEYVTERKLSEFSKLRQAAVSARFGKEFALEFTKDPRGIFNSLPRDQKIILMRMANNNDSNREGASTS